MNTEPSTGPINWNLRALMADAGMFQTTDLITPLRAEGIDLSREQIFRLVTRTPERLNVVVLAALCRILDCTPADLITVNPVAGQERRAACGRATTADAGIGELRPIRAKIYRPGQVEH